MFGTAACGMAGGRHPCRNAPSRGGKSTTGVAAKHLQLSPAQDTQGEKFAGIDRGTAKHDIGIAADNTRFVVIAAVVNPDDNCKVFNQDLVSDILPGRIVTPAPPPVPAVSRVSQFTTSSPDISLFTTVVDVLLTSEAMSAP